MIKAHHCHALACELACPPRMLFCPRHWRMTPKPIQALIWATYREGQEITKTPTRVYLVAQSYAVASIAVREKRWTTDDANAHVVERELIAGSGREDAIAAIRAELARLDPKGRALFLALNDEAPSDLWALTYWRPWPSAILFHEKNCENRTQPPPKHLLGKRVALHAGLTYSVGEWPVPVTMPTKEQCPVGIVGTVLLAGALDLRDPRTPKVYSSWGIEHRDQRLAIPEAEALHRRLAVLDRSPWWCGPVGLLVIEPRALEKPVVCKGAMGWWRVDPEHAREVSAQEVQVAA